jgi:hypothetical protein
MKPVAWIKESEIAGMSASAGLGVFEWKTNLGLKPEPGDVPLYTAPREWVSLESDEQILEISKDVWGKDKLNRGRDDHRPFYIDFARAIEAELREKNT